MSKEIKLGQIEAVATYDTVTLGYCLVLFTSDVFYFDPENREAAADNTQQIDEGNLVVRGK
jgi:hypothetical protein